MHVLIKLSEKSLLILLCRGIIENLVHLLGELGYVPNGGRAYYTRSQPPLLALMVWDYYKQVDSIRQIKLRVHSEHSFSGFGF